MDVSKIRNICVLAHVDHGKTSITDCLLASNGLISRRLAGKLRYLDSREDEQERGITMKASSIGINFEYIDFKPKFLVSEKGLQENVKEKFLINIVDSPGHVDFSSDVISAIRLCDGGFIVVDVVEGVCAQTSEVLKRACEEKLSLCLVLNKIDRLFTEKFMDVIEAYEQLLRVLEQVNGVLSSFLELDDDFDSHLFSPQKGNVVFASAIDNWAFGLLDVLPYVYQKLNKAYLPRVLLTALWGPYFLSKKDGKLKKSKDTTATESFHSKSTLIGNFPLFSELILQPLCDFYSDLVLDFHPKKITSLALSLGINCPELKKIHKIDKKFESKRRDMLRLLLFTWLPLSLGLLNSAVRQMKSPKEAQTARIDLLVPKIPGSADQMRIYNAIKSCESDSSSPFVAFVVKTFAIRRKLLSSQIIGVLSKFTSIDENQEEFLFSLARIFSGSYDQSMTYDILGPKYSSPDDTDNILAKDINLTAFKVMGPEVIQADTICAGDIVAFYGVSNYATKAATITNTSPGISLSQPLNVITPILHVSIQPQNSDDWRALVNGLKLLNKTDPVAQVTLASTGEYILGSIGELHLETCLKDLSERYAKVPITVSKPIVSFKESLKIISSDREELESFHLMIDKSFCSDSDFEEFLSTKESKKLIHRADDSSLNFLYTLCCLPLSQTFQIDEENGSLAEHLDGKQVRVVKNNVFLVSNGIDLPRNLLVSLASGFQIACESGPMFGEEVCNLLVVLTSFYSKSSLEGVDEGRCMSDFHHSIHHQMMRATLSATIPIELRIVEGYYECTLLCTVDLQHGDQLGKLYGVFNRRRGKITSEDLVSGTSNIFSISAILPVYESFGFVDEIRNVTSGSVSSPQLRFLKWDIFDENPYYKPTTEEELEDFGNMTQEQIVKENVASQILRDVRKRKGLLTNEKIVVAGEKQRTLSKKK